MQSAQDLGLTTFPEQVDYALNSKPSFEYTEDGRIVIRIWGEEAYRCMFDVDRGDLCLVFSSESPIFEYSGTDGSDMTIMGVLIPDAQQQGNIDNMQVIIRGMRNQLFCVPQQDYMRTYQPQYNSPEDLYRAVVVRSNGNVAQVPPKR